MTDLPIVVTAQDADEVARVPLADRDLPASTYALLARTAARLPDVPAWVYLPDPSDHDGAQTRTYAGLLARTEQVARALGALHRPDGRRVTAILSPTHLETPALLLGAQAAGVSCAVNHLLEPGQVAAIVQASGADVLVALGPSQGRDTWERALAVAARLPGLRALVQLRGDLPTDPDHPVLEDLADLQAPGPLEHPPGPGDVAAYFHTGGTTGAPKLAAHTHGSQVANAWMMNTLGEDRSSEGMPILAGLPWFHVNAFMVTGLATFALGATAVAPGPDGYRDPRFYASAWRLVERFEIAAMSAVPTVYGVLVQIPVDADVSSLRQPFVGAAPLTAALAQAWLAHTGVPLREGYGCTEATCTVTATPRLATPRLGAQGLPLPYSQVRVAALGDDTDAPLPAGEVGRVLVRGPHVFAGYVEPDGSLRRPVRDGWYDTGDLGLLEADGWLRLTGRAKDLIIRGGHNIDPASIVEALESHPQVAAAAAVGRPDAHAGEVPVAYVALAPGATTTPDELLAHAADTLGERAAVPKSITVLPALPTTAVGKVSLLPLREDAAVDAVTTALTAAGLVDQGVSARTDSGGRLHVTVEGLPREAVVAALAGLPVELDIP